MFRRSAIHGAYGQNPPRKAKWIPHLIEQCRYAGWTIEFPWFEKASCIRKPESYASSYAEFVTGPCRATSIRRAGMDVAQVAPNFTVNVLPPDVVCLYSEDRKFSLQRQNKLLRRCRPTRGPCHGKSRICETFRYWTSSLHFLPIAEGRAGLRAAEKRDGSGHPPFPPV